MRYAPTIGHDGDIAERGRVEIDGILGLPRTRLQVTSLASGYLSPRLGLPRLAPRVTQHAPQVTQDSHSRYTQHAPRVA